jgi:hypothetical protein
MRLTLTFYDQLKVANLTAMRGTAMVKKKSKTLEKLLLQSSM